MAVWAVTASAQAENESGTRFSLPILGYVLERAPTSLRPIVGIAGAASLGQPLQPLPEIQVVAASSRRGYALAAAGPNLDPILIRPSPGSTAFQWLEGAMTGVDRIVLSPGGNAALLYSRAAGRVQVVRGLPEAPGVDPELDLSSLDGAVSNLAVSDAGDAILIAVSQGQTGFVYVLGSDGRARFLSEAGAGSPVAFFAGRADAVIADVDRNTVFEVRNLAGTPEFFPLAGPVDGVDAPVAIEVSADNTRLLIANSGAGTIAWVDLASGRRGSVACDCRPTGLHRLAGNAVFRLAELSGEATPIFDGDALEPRVVLLPAEAAP